MLLLSPGKLFRFWSAFALCACGLIFRGRFHTRVFMFLLLCLAYMYQQERGIADEYNHATLSNFRLLVARLASSTSRRSRTAYETRCYSS